MDIANSIRKPNERTLTVADLASIFEISSQAVRLYHKKGLLMPFSIDENGYRRYSYNQIHTLAMICYLRKVNQPIAKIRAYLQILKLESDIQIQKSMEKAIQMLRITKPEANITAPQNATGQEEAMDIRQPWGRSSRERKRYGKPEMESN